MGLQGDTNPGVPSRGWHTLVRTPGPTAGQRVDRMGLAQAQKGEKWIRIQILVLGSSSCRHC